MSALIPFQEMESMAGYIVKSRLFGAKDESQAMSLMLLAQAEGLHPMTAIQDFDVVQGRPARKTHSILARFQSAGGKVSWEEISPLRACGVFSHPQGGSLTVEWTFEQAKKIGLTGKDNWKNYPKAMLRARCIAEGVRAVFPGAIGGMMSVEEAQDSQPQQPAPAKDMGPAPVVITQERRDQMLELVYSAPDEEALTGLWKQGVAEIKKANDMDLYGVFKDAIVARRAELLKPEAIEQPQPVEAVSETAWEAE